MRGFKNIREIVIISLLIAMQVMLTRFFSIQTPIVRIGFTFIPLAFSAMLYGPVKAGVAAALADVIGMMLFSNGSTFFPGFTLSAFLSGVAYGAFMYKKPKNIFHISCAVLTVCLVINLGLDTLWLSVLLGKGYLALLPARVIKSFAMIPVQVIMIKVFWRYVMERLVASYA